MVFALTLSKYFITLISGIIHLREEIFNIAKGNWLLPYWGWIISMLNKKWHVIFVLLYTPSNKTKSGSVLTRYRIFQWQHKYLLLIKTNSTGTIILNYLILIVVIIFLLNHSTLGIISKSIEFKLCHMKLITLKVNSSSTG